MKKILRKAIKPFILNLKNLLETVNYWELEDKDIPFDNNGPWVNKQFMKLYYKNRNSHKPEYLWGILQGAALGKVLGYDRISVMNLEWHQERA
jgi:hypothetical protein